MGFINKDLVNRQEEILKNYNLPVKLNGIGLDDILEAVKMDKKKPRNLPSERLIKRKKMVRF